MCISGLMHNVSSLRRRCLGEVCASILMGYQKDIQCGRNSILRHVVAVLVSVAICGAVYSVDYEAQAQEQTPKAVAEKEARHRLAIKIVETARHLIALGKTEEAYDFLRRAARSASAESADSALIRYMTAQALLADGHYVQAAEMLGRLIRERPGLERVSLDYAAVLFTLGRDDEADTIFRDMRRQEHLSPETKRQIETYLQRIRARQRWKLDFDLGFWRDDNVNNASEDESVAIPAFGGLRFTLDQRPVRALVARTGARLRWREPLVENGRLYMETHVSTARNTAVGASEYNRTWASLSTGPRLRYAAEMAGRIRSGLLLADLGIQRNWRGGDGYTRGLWAGIGVEQTIDQDWRVGGFPRVWHSEYDQGGDDAKLRGRSLDFYFARRIGSGWLTVGRKVAREAPERGDLGWNSRAASVRYATNIGRDWSLSAGAGLSRTTFDAVAPLFLTRREDRTRNISLTASHRKLAWEGYLPELTLNWSRTASNIPLYDREVRTLQLGIRRLF